MRDGCRIFFIEAEDDFGGQAMALDIAVDDDAATVADYLRALDGFAAAHLADCYGCDGCCHERAPLIAADIAQMAEPGAAYPAHQVCSALASYAVDAAGAADISLRRADDGSCMLLDGERHCCSRHLTRPFVCRSHFCLPQSDRMHRLRESIVNSGLDELTRLILAEEDNGAPPLDGDFCARLNAADYPPGGSAGASDYQQLRIKDIAPAELWAELTKKED
ncbi:MAG: YkgJ family cysteine cluster protein [Bacillota bacterium]|nr:YkgJ family cysteine cluster protein [Bacillota bacterium]